MPTCVVLVYFASSSLPRAALRRVFGASLLLGTLPLALRLAMDFGPPQKADTGWAAKYGEEGEDGDIVRVEWTARIVVECKW